MNADERGLWGFNRCAERPGLECGMSSRSTGKSWLHGVRAADDRIRGGAYRPGQLAATGVSAAETNAVLVVSQSRQNACIFTFIGGPG